MVIFVIYLASNQSCHFQKISQMNVLNAHQYWFDCKAYP